MLKPRARITESKVKIFDHFLWISYPIFNVTFSDSFDRPYSGSFDQVEMPCLCAAFPLCFQREVLHQNTMTLESMLIVAPKFENIGFGAKTFQ